MQGLLATLNSRRDLYSTLRLTVHELIVCKAPSAVAQDAHAGLQHQLSMVMAAHEQAQAEAGQLRAEGAAKVALLEDFELRFRQQQECALHVAYSCTIDLLRPAGNLPP